MKKVPGATAWACTFLLFSLAARAQTADTGALNGAITDATQAVIAGAQVKVVSQASGQQYTATTSGRGVYTVPLLQPGAYAVTVSAPGFETVVYSGVILHVSENQTLNVTLAVGKTTQVVTVSSTGEDIQMDTNALGRTVDAEVVESLPLVTRNFTQIVGLSAGVQQDVNNAAALGRGNGGLSFTGGFSVNGSRNYDNNFQLDGMDANDLFASGANSGGIAIPNPDTIEQFKVQTGQYSAAFGRNAGANVDIVTKGGGNKLHGTVFEFFRNDALNANDFFMNRDGLPRGALKQNQFGAALGGPIKPEKLFFFASYQRTVQRNGITVGCSSTFVGPPLTDDRSAAALGALFAGQTGAFGGVAVAADGSNINPVALAILQLKLPNGQYFIPTPVTVDAGLPFAVEGQYAQTGVCSFDENQFMGNFDYVRSEKSRFSSRFFYEQSKSGVPFSNGSDLPYPSVARNSFLNYSLAHTYVFSPRLLNEAGIGFHSIHTSEDVTAPFSYSGVGAAVPAQDNNYPFLDILGFVTNSGVSVNIPQKYYNARDSITYIHGSHTILAGAGAENVAIDFRNFTAGGTELFASFPDFLLGLGAGPTTVGGNGSFASNIFESVDIVGLTDRDYRVWNGFAYATDEFKLSRNLTLNYGVRYERLGDIYDALGRNGGVNPALLNPNPPASGTVQGYFVPANYQGAAPAGVTTTGNDYGIAGRGQDQFEPRLGFAWNVFPARNNIVIRGGYGIYYTRLVGQQYLQLVASPPFSLERLASGIGSTASEQMPFAPAPSFPQFIPYSPATALTPRILAQNYRPAQTQQYSLNTQMELAHGWLAEIGYVGARAQDLIRDVGINQAGLAGAGNPIRGVTTNTVANIQDRVPYQGFSASGFQEVESEGASWYNSLQTTLSKRLGHGTELQAAYTFSRLLDTDGGNATETSGGNVESEGNQIGQHARYGRSDANREHRVIISYVYALPNFLHRDTGAGLLTGGWSATGVTIIQSGVYLTIAGTNAFNATGTTMDRAELAPGCTNSQIGLGGASGSKLDHYFNTNCVNDKYPVVGDDGVATAFGNSGVGVTPGPGQQNFDIAIRKVTSCRPMGEAGNVEFRTELFNALNHAQFLNPNINVSDSSFGVITGPTAVNPRVIQLALKANF